MVGELHRGTIQHRICSSPAKLVSQEEYKTEYKSILPHGRLQQFGLDRIEEVKEQWGNIGPKETCRRIIDLIAVSVPLDAGAGPKWTYVSKKTGETYNRSPGLAIASLEMFEDGVFSGDNDQPYQVNRAGLAQLTLDRLKSRMQVTEENPIVGPEGRFRLLSNLGEALQNKEIFGADGRPGNMIGMLTTYVCLHPTNECRFLAFEEPFPGPHSTRSACKSAVVRGDQRSIQSLAVKHSY